MSNETTEKTKTAVAKPAEQIPAPAEVKKDAAQVEAKGSAEAKTQEAQPGEAKPSEQALSNLAFIRMRQEKKALKAELEKLRAAQQATAVTPQPAATGVTPGQQQANDAAGAGVDPNRLKAEILAEIRKQQETAQLEAQKKEAEETALKQLAEDKDLSSVPNGIVEALDLIDKDPRLSRLNEIDPAIAISEAKKAILAQKGIAPSAPAPVSHPKTGGSLQTAHFKDFDALAEKLKTMTPNTKEFRETVKRLNEAAKENIRNG